MYQKAKAGRFRLSLIEITKTFSRSESERDYAPEKEIKEYTVAINHGRKPDGYRDWINQKIWCTTEDFKNLLNAIDEFNELANSPHLEKHLGEIEYKMTLEKLREQMAEVAGDNL